jgi:hypothetical protein
MGNRPSCRSVRSFASENFLPFVKTISRYYIRAASFLNDCRYDGAVSTVSTLALMVLCAILGSLAQFGTSTTASIQATLLSLRVKTDRKDLLTRRFSLCKQPLAFIQLFLRSLVVKGKSLRCINLQSATEGRHRLGRKLGAFCPLGTSRRVPERVTQVVLG